jgi:hypothetical protein
VRRTHLSIQICRLREILAYTGISQHCIFLDASYTYTHICTQDERVNLQDEHVLLNAAPASAFKRAASFLSSSEKSCRLNDSMSGDGGTVGVASGDENGDGNGVMSSELPNGLRLGLAELAGLEEDAGDDMVVCWYFGDWVDFSDRR